MIEAVMTYVMDNLDALLGIATAVVAVASAIANLTPTETDNKLVATLSKVVNVLALNLKKK